jgi:hypothetical protein
MDPAPFQFSLLTPPARPVASPRASVQTTELVRVEGRIAELVLAFCAGRTGQTFHLAELSAYVSERAQVAPDSPRRILSQLRKTGQVAAECVSRSESLWRVAAAAGDHATGP